VVVVYPGQENFTRVHVGDFKVRSFIYIAEQHVCSRPPFTRACLNFFTLTFRALGRNHIASTPAGAIAMLCFN
jgi:hypothetical protein